MSNKGVITLSSRKKLAMARNGEIVLPIIKGIALGDGAEKDGELRLPLAEDVSLNHELLRKPYSHCEKMSDSSYRYRIELDTSELAGSIINEAALYDDQGDLVAIRVFSGKLKDDDIEMAFEFDDIF